ncbi:hypothetical protein ACQPZQ_30725 [Pseudonocardia sp. CA-142604]|uniref:hypothetical protein n=1 Tax=Pseudonocardia sp. CA-142604 TaxID=3240024 RepID=UPI003D91970C
MAAASGDTDDDSCPDDAASTAADADSAAADDDSAAADDDPGAAADDPAAGTAADDSASVRDVGATAGRGRTMTRDSANRRPMRLHVVIRLPEPPAK